MADISEVTVTGHFGFPNFLALPKSVLIGDLEVQTTIDERHSDENVATEHPVEAGANISDHVYSKPTEFVIRCGWSNSSLSAIAGIVKAFFTANSTMSDNDYVSGVYQQLTAFKEAKQLITVQTSLRLYKNVLIKRITAIRDKTTSSVLMVTVECRVMNLTSTKSTTLPDQVNQSTPSSTAETQSVGVLAPAPGAPNPGGSSPPSEWGF